MAVPLGDWPMRQSCVAELFVVAVVVGDQHPGQLTSADHKQLAMAIHIGMLGMLIMQSQNQHAASFASSMSHFGTHWRIQNPRRKGR